MHSVSLIGGTVLIHGDDGKITPMRTVLLVQDGLIAIIESSSIVPDDCEVIDCSDKVVSSDLVDTHYHLWQSLLKGLFRDSAFMPYVAVSTCSLIFHAKQEQTR